MVTSFLWLEFVSLICLETPFKNQTNSNVLTALWPRICRISSHRAVRTGHFGPAKIVCIGNFAFAVATIMPSAWKQISGQDCPFRR
jgi:hypothetical protein